MRALILIMTISWLVAFASNAQDQYELVIQAKAGKTMNGWTEGEPMQIVGHTRQYYVVLFESGLTGLVHESIPSFSMDLLKKTPDFKQKLNQQFNKLEIEKLEQKPLIPVENSAQDQEQMKSHVKTEVELLQGYERLQGPYVQTIIDLIDTNPKPQEIYMDGLGGRADVYRKKKITTINFYRRGVLVKTFRLEPEH